MTLLRPPLLRAGSLDANRVPSRAFGQRTVPPQRLAQVQAVAGAAPPATAPDASPDTGCSGRRLGRAAALAEARRLIAAHHITPADLGLESPAPAGKQLKGTTR